MPALHIEGYVIVSADGMLADASGVMPEALKFEGDKEFFTNALDHADLIVHGRHSHEGHPNSTQRKRVVVTRKIAGIAEDPAGPKTILWNPSGAPFEAACDRAGVHSGTIAVLGGPEVFDMFMDRYDTFWLSQAAKVRLPDGEPVFSGVPRRTPQEILSRHGLAPGESRLLDAVHGVTVTPWRRTAP